MRMRLAVGLVVALAAPAAAQQALEPFAGRYPTDRVRGRTFVEAVRPLVQPVVGDARWRRLQAYGTSSPIEAASDREFGRVLIAWQCRPHDCGNQATVVVTIAGELVAACFADGTRAEWFGPGWRGPGREADCGWEPPEVLARIRAARARR
jgi:hypothetical protein